MIAGANEIADFPYVFGGGHASFVDNAYDCSGSVSYALAAGGLLSAPETSGELESWGAPGPGRYITVLANAGHTYMYVNGMLYNTAGPQRRLRVALAGRAGRQRGLRRAPLAGAVRRRSASHVLALAAARARRRMRPNGRTAPGSR